MKDIQREDIYILSQHSDLTEREVDTILQENVYSGRVAWGKFLQLFFITLGVGFTLSGIIFFFAYNWADLHKFVKIGIIETLIVVATSLVLFLKVDMLLRNILLTASAVLVGVLFAIFGQVYQTGANAFDFFLAWTLLITIWVAVSNFAPLWLIFLTLINVTFIMYTEQIVSYWHEVTVFTCLFLINAAAVLAAILIAKFRPNTKIPNWFLNTVTIFALIFATGGMIHGIFDDYQTEFLILLAFVVVLFSLGLWHGIKAKSGFYISTIPFAMIVIVDALLIKSSDGEMMLLLIGLFNIGSITGVIKNLIEMQKKWNHEN